MGRLSMRRSRSAWVSVSIQWRFSMIRSSGCPWHSHSSRPLDGREGALAAVSGLELLPVQVLDRHIEEREERRRGGPEAASRVRSLQVSFSRIVRQSSRSSRWK